jgi:hypothetical protein
MILDAFMTPIGCLYGWTAGSFTTPADNIRHLSSGNLYFLQLFQSAAPVQFHTTSRGAGKKMKNRELKWCGLDCEHASFPEQESLDGACHTFIALYCSKYDRLVQKSGLCLDLAGNAGHDDED